MDLKVSALIIVGLLAASIYGRTLVLNENEAQRISSALKEALERHHIATSKDIEFEGVFDCLSSTECEVTFDISNTHTENGVLSGNDVLNGLANGNGNDNGHSGNNNGNVVLQIFNIPLDEALPTQTSTEKTSTTNSWWTEAAGN
jgi:hypothetical protein